MFIPLGEVFKAESQLVVVSIEFRITWNFRQEDLSDLKWTLKIMHIKSVRCRYSVRKKTRRAVIRKAMNECVIQPKTSYRLTMKMIIFQ